MENRAFQGAASGAVGDLSLEASLGLISGVVEQMTFKILYKLYPMIVYLAT